MDILKSMNMDQDIAGTKSNTNRNGRVSNYRKANSYIEPKFNLKELRDAIPPHCFQSNIFISILYLSLDLACLGALFSVGTLIPGWHYLIRPLAWLIYWILMPLPMVALWILAHECAHGSFSRYSAINNAIGLAIHSFLGMPFYSWKFTHALHHKSAGSFEKDVIHIPLTRDEVKSSYGVDPGERGPNPVTDKTNSIGHELIDELPLFTIIKLTLHVIFGFPLYLIANLGGQKYQAWTSHYLPESEFFERKNAQAVKISNAGVASWLAILLGLAHQYGYYTVRNYYLIPWIQVNAWLAVITYLQHTHVSVPRFSNSKWTFLQGALATIDRDWGYLNTVFHHMMNTHVVHHLFKTIPFYHAQEATNSIKKVLGDHYLKDDSGIVEGLWNSWKFCRFIDVEDEIMFFKH